MFSVSNVYLHSVGQQMMVTICNMSVNAKDYAGVEGYDYCSGKYTTLDSTFILSTLYV